VTDPHRDPERINTKCIGGFLFHTWLWRAEKGWTCERCGEVAHGLRFADTPCKKCSNPTESVYGLGFCDPCLDAMLDPDDDYVPFAIEEYKEGDLP
jgi:hypothetical protein